MQRLLELGGGSSGTWRTQLSFPHYPCWFSAFLKQFLNEALPTNPCFKVCFWWTNSKERDHVIKRSVLRSTDSHSVSLYVWLLGRYAWFTQATNIKIEIHMWVIWLEVNYFLSLFGIKYNYIISLYFTPLSNSSHNPLDPSQTHCFFYFIINVACSSIKKYINTA